MNFDDIKISDDSQKAFLSNGQILNISNLDNIKEVGKYGARRRPPEMFSKEENQKAYENLQAEINKWKTTKSTFVDRHQAGFQKWMEF